MDTQTLSDRHLLIAQAQLLTIYTADAVTEPDAAEQLKASHREVFQEAMRRGILSRQDIINQLNPAYHEPES